MDLASKRQELERLQLRLSNCADRGRRFGWALGISLLVCLAALVTMQFAVSAIAFIATGSLIFLWVRFQMHQVTPLEREVGNARTLVERLTEAPNVIEPRCEKDTPIDSSKWKPAMSHPFITHWLPGEVQSLQPGDVVLHYCTVGFPNFGGITRYKIERMGRVVAQYTTIHSAPFNGGA